MKSWYLVLVLALAPAAWIVAAEEHSAAASAGKTEVVDSAPHPNMPHESAWPGGMAITILALFVLAAAAVTLPQPASPVEAEPAHAAPQETGSGHH